MTLRYLDGEMYLSARPDGRAMIGCSARRPSYRMWIWAVQMVRFGRIEGGRRGRRPIRFPWRERRAVLQRHRGFR